MYPWASRAALVVTAIAWAQLFLAGLSTAPFLVTVGLGALVALVVGVPMGLIQAAIALLPRKAQWSIWLSSGALLGAFLVLAFGLFHRTRSVHATLGLLVAACLAGALFIGAPLALLQPQKSASKPKLSAPWLTPRARYALIAALVVAGLIVCAYENSTWWLRNYLAFKRALAGASWALVAMGALLLLEQGSTYVQRANVGLYALLGVGVVASARVPTLEIQALAIQGHTEHIIALLRYATDWDRDGSSSFFGGGDCAPFDPTVHPRAREIPDNGRDDNCRYGDAKGIPQAPASPERVPPPSPVNVLLVTIDSLRAAHTTPYGYARNTTPHLAKLAEQGTVYWRAYTSGALTCLALPSLLMGSYPRRMPFRPVAVTWEFDFLELPFEPKLKKGDNFRLMLNTPDPRTAWLLQRALGEQGMRTIAVYSWYVRYVVEPMGGGWHRQLSPKREEDSDQRITDLALEELAQLRGEPFFLWVHYFGPHDPPTWHEGVPQFGSSQVDRYDHEIAATDRELGRLVEAVDALTERPTVIVVTSDHGESFEGGVQFHGLDLFEESVRIPLVVRSGSSPAVVDTPVSLVDVAPTILRLTGNPHAPPFDGVDLEALPSERVVLTDVWRLDRKALPELDQVGAHDRHYHLVLDRLTQTLSLYRADDWQRPPTPLPPSSIPQHLRSALGAYEEYHVGGP